VDSSGPGSVARLAAGLTAAAVLAQISYPLLSGDALRFATIVAVLLFAAAGLVHATRCGGARAALTVLLVAGGVGLAAEAIGVATGWPFGRYRYHDTLGPALLGVPLLVPLAWTMMAYPALLLGRRLAERSTGVGRRVRTALAGAVTLAGWDLFLDPQMVGAGHWTWSDPTPGLPGVPDVPLSNTAGWLLVGVLITALLDLTVPRRPPGPAGQGIPAILLGWTWLGSAVGNLAFFDRPAVACYGLIGMGVTVLPYLLSIRRRHPGPLRARTRAAW